MTYRIYWPDLDDYSAYEKNTLETAVEWGKNCVEPFVVVDDRGFPSGIVYTSVGVLPGEPV